MDKHHTLFLYKYIYKYIKWLYMIIILIFFQWIQIDPALFLGFGNLWSPQLAFATIRGDDPPNRKWWGLVYQSLSTCLTSLLYPA